MRMLPLLAVLLAAAPVSAQFAMPDASGIKAGAQDLAKRKAQQAAALAAAAKAAAAKRAITLESSFPALVERLIKDGEDLGLSDGGALHTFQKTEKPSPLSSRIVSVGVIEAPPAEGEGRLGEPGSNYRDLLERHTYTGVRAEVVTVTIDPAKKAVTIERRVYVVSLGGAVSGGVAATGSVPIPDDGQVVIDDAVMGSLKAKAQSAAEAGPGWQALKPELLRMYKVTEI